jgi:KUP system potassium uptake protein
MRKPEDYSPLPAPAPVTPPTLPPDFPDIPQNPSSELQPPPPPSAPPDEVAGATLDRAESEESAGQVYVPQVNWLLAALVLALVFGFRSSDALANAYGIAVAGDMMVTTLLVTVVAYALWRWPAILVFPVAGLFFLLDVTFVSANVHKIPTGGWFPLLAGFIALTLMLVWRKGRRVAFEQRDQNAIGLAIFIASLDQPGAPARMNGTAVYLTRETPLVPAALELNVRHNGIVHEHVRSLEGHD